MIPSKYAQSTSKLFCPRNNAGEELLALVQLFWICHDVTKLQTNDQRNILPSCLKGRTSTSASTVNTQKGYTQRIRMLLAACNFVSKELRWCVTKGSKSSEEHHDTCRIMFAKKTPNPMGLQ